jgi:hypothetical protein
MNKEDNINIVTEDIIEKEETPTLNAIDLAFQVHPKEDVIVTESEVPDQNENEEYAIYEQGYTEKNMLLSSIASNVKIQDLSKKTNYHIDNLEKLLDIRIA